MTYSPYRQHNVDYLNEPTYVYVLMNPDTKDAFYIGISVSPWGRFEQHYRDPCSAAYRIMRMLFDGRNLFHRDEILKIYKRCATRQEALDLEYRLVTTTPNLLNRPYRRGRSY